MLDAALYVIGLFTVGYLPLGSALLGIVWAAAATQLGAIAVGRYAPYAGGIGAASRRARSGVSSRGAR